MEIIDVQLHEPAPWQPWPYDDVSRVALGVELTLALMDSAGVDAALLTSCRPAYTAEAIRLHPRRFACLAEYDPDDPNIEQLVAGTRENPGALGLRLLAGWPPENVERLRTGGFSKFFAAAERYNVPVAIFISGAISAVLPVLRNFPNLQLIIDHFGHKQPPYQERDEPPLKHADELIALAQFPNVSVKISGGPSMSRETFPYRDLWPQFHRIIEAFGASRLMWGSDITRINGLVRTPAISDEDYRHPSAYPGKHSYAEALHFLLHSDQLADNEKKQIFGSSVRRIFRWALPGDAHQRDT
jgi:L-fuconolactonase